MPRRTEPRWGSRQGARTGTGADQLVDVVAEADDVVLLGRPGPVGRESELDDVVVTLLAGVLGFLLGVLLCVAV